MELFENNVLFCYFILPKGVAHFYRNRKKHLITTQTVSAHAGFWIAIDDSSFWRNFDLDKKNEIHYYIAGKSIVKWVRLQSLVVNCCKLNEENIALWSSQILYQYLHYAGGK
jgi:hypothetical protein